MVVSDGIALDENTVDDVSSLDGTNTDTVATSARVVGKDNVLGRVDSDAVILVDDGVAAGPISIRQGVKEERFSRDGEVSRR